MGTAVQRRIHRGALRVHRRDGRVLRLSGVPANLVLGFARTVATVGLVANIVCVVTRGFAAHRVPWGNMYEYSVLLALLVVAGYLLIVEGYYKIRTLGGFALMFSVFTMAIAVSFLYVGPGPRVLVYGTPDNACRRAESFDQQLAHPRARAKNPFCSTNQSPTCSGSTFQARRSSSNLRTCSAR